MDYPDFNAKGAANCAKEEYQDVDFFPDPYEKGAGLKVRLAAKVCGSCSYLDECREWGISQQEEYGIWGGLSTSQRRKVNRTRQKSLISNGRL